MQYRFAVIYGQPCIPGSSEDTDTHFFFNRIPGAYIFYNTIVEGGAGEKIKNEDLEGKNEKKERKKWNEKRSKLKGGRWGGQAATAQ